MDDNEFFIRPRNLGSKKNFGLNLNNRAGAVNYVNFGKIENENFPINRECYYPFYNIFVDYNGDTLICPNDWDKRKVIGNVNKSNILDLWNNEQFNQVRKRLINKNRSEKPCEKCNVNGLHVGKNSFKEWSEFFE